MPLMERDMERKEALGQGPSKIHDMDHWRVLKTSLYRV